MKTPVRNPLLSALRAVRSPVDVVPPGFHTAQEWARQWKMEVHTVTRLLTQGISARLIERRSFRIRQADGGARPIPHYAERK